MESSPLQRRVTFGLIVLILAGLGAYLINSAARGSARPPAAGPPAPTATPQPSREALAPSAPAGSAPAAGASAPDIYQWLPFTSQGLGAAASAARRFAAVYGTFSYTETGAAYAARLQPLASAALVGEIQNAYSLPGVAAARSAARQVSAGSAMIDSIRAFGAGSLTFVVQVTENLTASSGRSQNVTQYAITLTGSGSTWQVSDIELATAGNP
jgi:hypothetical protein